MLDTPRVGSEPNPKSLWKGASIVQTRRGSTQKSPNYNESTYKTDEEIIHHG